MRIVGEVGIALLCLHIACTPPPADPPPTKSQPTEPAPVPKPEPEPEPEPLPTAAGVSYLEVVTGGAAADAELPMVLAIHGRGDSPQGFVGLVQGFERPARFILPRALDEELPGWSWFPIRAADPDVEAIATGMERAADALTKMTAELTDARPTVGKPVVTGFSQGGMLTFALATKNPEQFSGAIAVGGWLPPPLWPAKVEDPSAYPPIVALHGDEDRALVIENTREAVAALKKLGLDVVLHEYSGVGHSIPPPMRQQLFDLLGERVDAAKEATP